MDNYVVALRLISKKLIEIYGPVNSENREIILKERNRLLRLWKHDKKRYDSEMVTCVKKENEMKQKYTLTTEQFNKILAINKEGGDPVMYLSGGVPLGKSLQEKINDFWDELGKEMKFDRNTIEPIDNTNFYAESIP